MPRGEHSAGEGIFQHLSLPARWMHLEDCAGLDIFLHTGFAPWAAGTGAAQLTEKGMLERSWTCCRHGGDTPHPARGRSGLGAGGDCRWKWTRLCALAQTVLTHHLCGEQPCPWVVGEGVKVPCRARWEQPAGIIPWLQGQGGPGSLEQEMLHCGPCLWYCTLSLHLPCPGIPCRGNFFS